MAPTDECKAASVREPPTETTFQWCPVCGQTDRYQPFTGAPHFYRGKRCNGQPKVLIYDFREVLHG